MGDFLNANFIAICTASFAVSEATIPVRSGRDIFEVFLECARAFQGNSRVSTWCIPYHSVFRTWHSIFILIIVY